VRRAVLAAALTDEPPSDEHLGLALDELMSDAQRLTRSLLGVGSRPDEGLDGAEPGMPSGRLPRPAEPACTTWSEKTRVAGTPDPRQERPNLSGAGLRHARSQVPAAASCRTPGRRPPSRSKNPTSQAIRNGTRKLSAPLDKHLLTLV